MERKRERFAWATLAAAALAVSFLPFDAPFRYPAKLFAACVFAFSLRVAEGLEGLRFALRGRSRALAGVFALAASALGASLLCRPASERATIGSLGILLALAAWDRSPGRSGFFAALAAASAAAHLVFATLPLQRNVELATLLRKPLPSRGKVLTSQDEILANWANSA